MEIKVGCGCGQNYAFDIEPVNGQMPVTVACPGCGTDGTESANQFLAQQLPPASTAPVALRLSVPTPASAVAVPPPISGTPGPITPRPKLAPSARPKKSGEFNFGMGILGAVVGAALGAGLLIGFFAWTHVRFPLMGTIIGALTGFGAKTLAKGTESVMGAISGAIAVAATFGVLYLMYGGVAVMFIVTLAVSAYFAYRIAG